MYKIAQRVQGGAGRIYDLDLLDEVTQNMEGSFINGVERQNGHDGLPDVAAGLMRHVWDDGSSATAGSSAVRATCG